jgi:hypothetical protein
MRQYQLLHLAASVWDSSHPAMMNTIESKKGIRSGIPARLTRLVPLLILLQHELDLSARRSKIIV